MSDYRGQDRETVIRQLVASGIARYPDHAAKLLDEMAEKKRRADLFIFYSDFRRTREYFGKHMVDERPYNSATISVAAIPSGVMSQTNKAQGSNRTLVIGALKEFAPRPADDKAITDEPAKLVALAKGLPFRNKSGIFFSPFSAEEVHARGGTTIDEKEDLFRIEFEPIAGDYVLGMFNAWSQQPEKETLSLLLYMSKSKVMSV